MVDDDYEDKTAITPMRQLRDSTTAKPRRDLPLETVERGSARPTRKMELEGTDTEVDPSLERTVVTRRPIEPESREPSRSRAPARAAPSRPAQPSRPGGVHDMPTVPNRSLDLNSTMPETEPLPPQYRPEPRLKSKPAPAPEPEPERVEEPERTAVVRMPPMEPPSPSSSLARIDTVKMPVVAKSSAWARLGEALADVWRESWSAAARSLTTILPAGTSSKLQRRFGAAARGAKQKARAAKRACERGARSAAAFYSAKVYQAKIAVARYLRKKSPTPDKLEWEADPNAVASRQRARDWEKFRKGKTSSSYLQDEE